MYLHDNSETQKWLGLRSALFLDFAQRRIVVRCRRFGTTSPSHLKGSSSSLKMGPTGCPETSVRNYHTPLRNVPNEHKPNLYRRCSLKSRVIRIHEQREINNKITETYVKAKSLEPSRTRKADIPLTDQEVLHYYPKPMDHYHVYNYRHWTVSRTSWNSVHILTSDLYKIHFKIIFSLICLNIRNRSCLLD